MFFDDLIFDVLIVDIMTLSTRSFRSPFSQRVFHDPVGSFDLSATATAAATAFEFADEQDSADVRPEGKEPQGRQRVRHQRHRRQTHSRRRRRNRRFYRQHSAWKSSRSSQGRHSRRRSGAAWKRFWVNVLLVRDSVWIEPWSFVYVKDTRIITRPDTRHKMRLVCVHFTFENNAGPTDRRTDGPTDGHDLL